MYIHYLNANGSVKSTVKINENTANGPSVHSHGNYGNSVENIGDLDGDGVNDLAVGELNHDSHSGEGAVNIHFLNANGSIKSTVKIDPSTMAGDKTSSNQSYVFFGSSITNIGDHNRDGVTDIAVGSNEGYYNEDGTHRGEMSKGSVYLLHMKTDGTVKESFRIDEDFPSGPQIGNGNGAWHGQFGSSIAAADIDGDFRLDLVVGSPGDNTAGGSTSTQKFEGSVWVIFESNGATYLNSFTQAISETLTLTDKTGKASEIGLSETISLTDAVSGTEVILLSESVSFTDTAITQDLIIGLSESLSLTDSISFERSVTQAISETVSLTDVLENDDGKYEVSVQETISFTDSTTGDIKTTFMIYDSGTVEITKDSDGVRQGFGSGMTSLGDLDGNGVMDLAVGATQGDMLYGSADMDNGNGWYTDRDGAVYIMFMETDGTVKSTVTIDEDTTNGPSFVDSSSRGYGKSIANLGDLDGDGVTDIAVGHTFEEGKRGAVYIHYLNTDGSIKSTATIKDGTTNGPDLAAGDFYGSDIANMGDLDGDGVIDIAVGADEDSSNGTDKGAVYIHYLNSDGSLKEDTVKIRHGTTNGPDITYSGGYGNSVENIGDFDGDGVNDMAIGEMNKGGGNFKGYLHISFMNANGFI